MKTIFILTCLILISGCAYVHVTPNEFTSITLCKDVKFDPNGLESTSSGFLDKALTGLGIWMVGKWVVQEKDQGEYDHTKQE